MVMWPIARVCGNDPRALEVFVGAGLDFAQLMEPDARMPHGVAMSLLTDLVAAMGDPELGLKAGLAVRRGDMALVEVVANTRPTLRSAAELVGRYFKLVNSAGVFRLTEEGDVAHWTYETPGVIEPPAAHDLVVAALQSYVRIFAGRDERRLAVHFAHGDRTNLEAYRRIFQCDIKFDQRYTGTAFSAERLDWAIRDAIFGFAPALEAQASEQLARVEAERSFGDRVRDTLLANLERGLDTAMSAAASRLGMSVATLRRRLAEEGTTHTQVLDDARKHLALSMIENRRLGVADVSHLLGFSDPAAYHRAFRRWTGTTPGAYAKLHRDHSED